MNARSDSDDIQRFLICDRRGRVLREIRDFAIVDVGPVELTGRPPTELRVSTWSGGAYASFTDVFFGRESGLHTMLIFRGGDLGIREIRHLDRGLRPQIIADNPVLGDFSGYTFHRHYSVVTILEWDGRRFVDRTRRYPAESIRQARKLRSSILSYFSEPDEYHREWELHDLISAYDANMMAVGRGALALRWLHRHLHRRDWRWISDRQSELRRIVAAAARRRGGDSQRQLINLTTG